MKTKSVLVIDDSSTIRRLADGALGRAGYTVSLAPTAEDGLRMAKELRPDLILLDHQLPGTTGFNVCQQLLASDDLRKIPVVISSTLRKRAYIEYSELSNVVDMLPKPYTEDLLVTTVSNALDTGSMVVDSQTHGTAVPEVIDEMADCALSGVCATFSVREILDFLNNGQKQGTLEIDAGQRRYWIHLDEGRIQGIVATGVPISEIIGRLPDTLQEVAPVLNLTMGRGGEAHGIIDLLNTNVLDPRLLRKLLRHQAAILLLTCFREKLRSFRFDTTRSVPALFQRLPLGVSVLALLVEGALSWEKADIPSDNPATRFTRNPIRGQNLDRAGLTAQQSRILGRLSSSQSLHQLVEDLGMDVDAVRRVLYGLELAELVTAELPPSIPKIAILERDLARAESIHLSLQACSKYEFQVSHDELAFRLLLKRSQFAGIVVDLSGPKPNEFCQQIRQQQADRDLYWIGVSNNGTVGSHFQAVLPSNYSPSSLIQQLDQRFGGPSGVEVIEEEVALCAL